MATVHLRSSATRKLFIALITMLVAACGDESTTGDLTTDDATTDESMATNSLSGVVEDFNGDAVAGATVTLEDSTATTGADGRYQLDDLQVGNATVMVSAPGHLPAEADLALVAGTNLHDVVLMPTGAWDQRANLLAPLSELALAHADGKLYLMGGYPATRVTSTTVQVYDIASDTWSLGPNLPLPNNHGTAAAVDGKVYLIGGQTQADDPPGTNSYVDTVYELDPAVGTWVAKAPMPTARSSGAIVVLDDLIYVAGGRPPHEKDFAVYDPAADTWQVLPELPTRRNHFSGAAIAGRLHFVGGRQGLGLGQSVSAVHEVYDPPTQTWTTAALLLPARSGMNGIMARGCFHIWGGEGPFGLFHNHDFYDPRTDEWHSLLDMPLPIHGVNGSAFVGDVIWISGGGNNVGGSSGTTLNQVYRPEVSCE
jgi:hypothetical protein